MSPLRIAGLIGVVFAVSLPFTFVMKNGVPRGIGTAFFDQDCDYDTDDPVVDELCLKGMLYFSDKKYDRAIEAYSAAIRRDSKYVYAYIGRGDVYSAKGDLDRALADYDYAARLDPRNQEAKVRAEMIREERLGR
jgi:tetratricopeptide (TPR) repeat protein